MAVAAEQQAKLLRLAGFPAVLGVRPEDLKPAAEEAAGRTLKGKVSVVEPLGDRMDVYGATERHDQIICRVDARSPVREGQITCMQVDMNRVHFFEPEAEGRNLTLAGGLS